MVEKIEILRISYQIELLDEHIQRVLCLELIEPSARGVFIFWILVEREE